MSFSLQELLSWSVDQIMALVRDFEPLDPIARGEVLDYLLKFFDIVSTPRRAQQQMFRDCRR